MKHIFTLSLLLAATAASARQISPDEARHAADAFLNSKSLVPVEAASGLTRSDAQPYYVFNAADNQGFVIISGDDRYSKVLGYSDRGNFDANHMPPQLKAMLDNFAEKSSKGTSLTDAIHPSWTSTQFSTRADEGVLLETAEWGQDAPFNAETPMFGDQHAPTGCVATAMAIVMKYHNWPETYNWDAMPMKIETDGENPPAANPELARLMKDAGESVHMSYGPIESGAVMFYVGPAMRYTFDYNPECQYIEAIHFQKDFWKNEILENINNGNPVIYAGSGIGSHAFVFDGYNSEGFHVNWGWDGWCNGYYDIEALNPGGSYFNRDQSMVLNIIPNKGKESFSQCYTDYGYEYVGAGLGETMNVSVKDVKTGEPFHLVHSFGITAKSGFDGVIGIALIDKDNNIKEVLRTEPLSTYSPGDNAYVDTHRSVEFLNLTVTVDVNQTDRLQLVSKDNRDDDFKFIPGTLEVPSSVSVINNSPRYSEYTFDIEEGITFNYSPLKENIKLPSGKSKGQSLKGLLLNINWTLDKADTDQTVGVFITSPSDTIVYSSKAMGIGIDYPDKANIKATILTLKEKSLSISTPGSLKSLVSLEEAASIRNLSLSGKMDATDFWYIRDCFRSLESLDLKDVSIEECHAVDKGTYVNNHPANVLPGGALWGANSITKLILPTNLVGIDENALGGVFCTTLTIPQGVSEIKKSNFGDIKAFEILNPEPPIILPITFLNADTPSNAILYVPEGTADKYKQADVWKDFKHIIEGTMPTSLFSIISQGGVKYECGIDEAIVVGSDSNTEDIIIPDVLNVDGESYKVTKIQQMAFNGCESIQSATIGNNVTVIEKYAFEQCSNLIKVVLGTNVKSIGDRAFAYNAKLEECNLPNSLETLGERAFASTRLKNVTIPAKAAPLNNQPVFNSMYELERFTVDKDNKWFKAIDDCLYRISDDGLILESVPNLKDGVLKMPDECVGLMANSIYSTQIDKLIFNDNCLNIPEYAVEWNNDLKHITIPKNGAIYPNAFNHLYNLQAVTFTGNLRMQDNIFNDCPLLENVVIDSTDKIVNLNSIFGSSIEEINIFTSSKEKNFEYSGKYKLFVVGAATDEFKNDEATEVQEMWKYGIDHELKLVTITPQVDGLAVERVLINGKEAENLLSSRGDFAPAFACAIDDLDNLNVKVEYTLFGSQKMSCDYNSEFNAKQPDTPSGIEQLWINSSIPADVYTIDGLLIKKASATETLTDLQPGIYLLRQGNKTRKIVVK